MIIVLIMNTSDITKYTIKGKMLASTANQRYFNGGFILYAVSKNPLVAPKNKEISNIRSVTKLINLTSKKKATTVAKENAIAA